MTVTRNAATMLTKILAWLKITLTSNQVAVRANLRSVEFRRRFAHHELGVAGSVVFAFLNVGTVLSRLYTA